MNRSEICRQCGGKCCREASWRLPLPELTRVHMAEVGERVYSTPTFWRQEWPHLIVMAALQGCQAAPLRILKLARRVSPQDRRVWLVARCLKHDRATGLCTIYDERPAACRRFPQAKNVRLKHTREWCPLAARLWKARHSPHKQIGRER